VFSCYVSHFSLLFFLKLPKLFESISKVGFMEGIRKKAKGRLIFEGVNSFIRMNSSITSVIQFSDRRYPLSNIFLSFFSRPYLFHEKVNVKICIESHREMNKTKKGKCMDVICKIKRLKGGGMRTQSISHS